MAGIAVDLLDLCRIRTSWALSGETQVVDVCEKWKSLWVGTSLDLISWLDHVLSDVCLHGMMGKNHWKALNTKVTWELDLSPLYTVKRCGTKSTCSVWNTEVQPRLKRSFSSLNYLNQRVSASSPSQHSCAPTNTLPARYMETTCMIGNFTGDHTRGPHRGTALGDHTRGPHRGNILGPHRGPPQF